MDEDTENPTYQDLKQYKQSQAAGATHITIPADEINTVADVLYMTWLRIGLNEPGKEELHHILTQLGTLNR